MQIVLFRHSRNEELFYYSLDDGQQSLFHPHALTVRWGNRPEGQREKQFFFATQDEKNRKVRKILNDKLKTYQVMYSYFSDRRGEADEILSPELRDRIS